MPLDVTRRAAIAGTLAAPFLNLSTARGQAKRKVTFTLSWVADGSNAYAYVAKEKGFWDARGLDVQISRGYGSVAAAQAVGSGQFQFGLAAASAGIQQAAKNLPLVSLAAFGYDGMMGVVMPADSPIKSPADLNGHSMACTTASGEYPFLPLFAEKAGFDLKRVDITQADPNVRQQLMMSRKVDSMSGLAISIIPIMLAANLQPRSFLYSRYGIVLYNYALLTKPEFLRAEPDLCAAFTDGLLEAAKFTTLNPEESVKMFVKQLPETALSANGPRQIRDGMGLANVTMLQDATQKHGLGYSDPADYESMTDKVMTYVASPGDTRPNVAGLFSNAAVGKITYTPEEWAKAQALAAPYKAYFG